MDAKMEVSKLSTSSSMDVSEVVMKVLAFLLIQLLVYLVLSKSSHLFSSSSSSSSSSASSTPSKSRSFRLRRSTTIDQFLASIFEFPHGVEAISQSKVAEA